MFRLLRSWFIIMRIEFLNDEAHTAYVQKEYDRGIQLAQQACQLAEAHSCTHHQVYALSLNNLALSYKGQYSFNRAEKLYNQALTILRDALGTNHPHYATTLNNLAGLYREIGRWEEAKELYLEALPIIRNRFGTRDPHYGVILHNLALLYEKVGRVEQAEEWHNEVLQIIRSNFGTNDLKYATGLSYLAFFYQQIGRVKEAETIILEALQIVRSESGPNHPNYARVLSLLASLYEGIGRLNEADKLLLTALQIRQNYPMNLDYAGNLNDLAMLYEGMDRVNEAEILYNLALPIMRDVLGTDRHPYYAGSLNNLGWLYTRIGRYNDAERLLQTALQITENLFGTNHYHYTLILNNLAVLYSSIGRKDEAERLLRTALQIRQDFLGINHPDYAKILFHIAELYAARSRPESALKLMQEATEIETRRLGEIFSMSSDKQRLAYIQQNLHELETFLSLVTRYLPNNSEAIQAAFDLVIRRKALGFEADTIQRTAILSDRYSHLALQLKQLRQIERAIANLYLQVPSSPVELENNRVQLARLYQQRDELDRSLSREIPEMNLQKQLDTASRRAIALALPEGATLVEFVRFHVYNFAANLANDDSQWFPARYLAFILPAREPERVEMIDLGEAEPIDNLIKEFRQSVSGERGGLDLGSIPNNQETIPIDARLHQELIDRLTPYLIPHQQLFFAPDGELACLPFGILPTPQGGRLMEAYQISYLSVGRDLLRYVSQTTRKQPSQPLVIADPDFNLSDSGLTETPRSPTIAEVRSDNEINQQLYQDLREGNGNRFPPLPASRFEAEQVAEYLGVTPHLGAQAVKSLVTSCQSPFVLHIGTHGCFLEDHLEPRSQQLNAFNPLYSAASQNPLMRSVIAFAGANTFLQGGTLPATAEDGLLSAVGASGIDLAATALVVTSGCQTALGDVSVGEGVLGLRRAFMLAGAKTLIMSLWKVPDVATAILMERFYYYLLQENMGRAVALEKAQFYVRDLTIAEMRPKWLTPEAITSIKQRHSVIGNKLERLSRKPDNYRPYKDPCHWGAFICIGDASPLPDTISL